MSQSQEKRNKLETIEHSYPYPEKGKLSSGYQTPSQKTSVSDFYPNVFELQAQDLMPLMASLKSENIQLSESKQKLAGELTLLAGVSQSILNENDELRKHYQERTYDVGKLVHTMSINAGENQTDAKQLIDRVKGRNTRCFREIQNVQASLKQNDQEIMRIEEQLRNVTDVILKDNESIRNSNVRRQQLKKKVEELQFEKDSLFQSTIFPLEKEVSQLIFLTKKSKQKNLRTLKTLKTEKTQVLEQKPKKTQQTIDTIRNIKAISLELSVMKDDLMKEELRYQQLQGKEEKLKEKKNEMIKQFNKKGQKNTILEQRNKQMIESKKFREQKLKQVNSNKEELQYERNKMQKNILKLKESISKKQTTFEQKRAEVLNQKGSKINKIKNRIRNIENDTMKKIRQFEKEKSEKSEKISYLKNYFETLDNETEEKNKHINTMVNPIREIKKLEFQLKRKTKQ